MKRSADGPGLVVIAGGGTAGHVVPAIAVAEALVARGRRRADLLFVGASRGLEARLVPEAGFSVVLLPGRGIARRLTIENVAAAAGLVFGVMRAFVVLVRRRPVVVLSVGGYASVPCALAAVVLRIPLVVAESNSVAGAANRLTGRFARASGVAFAGTGLPRQVVTGNPVRSEIIAAAGLAKPAGRDAARALLGLPPDRWVIVVTGGSLGSRRINEAVLEMAGSWAKRADVAIHHVVGSRDWAQVSDRLPTPPPGGLHYSAVEYESRMPDVLTAADLFVGRSGATTVAELAVMGLPSILVPLPRAPGDHQSANARSLVEAGGALVVADAELTGERLAELAGALVSDPGRLAAMSEAARGLARPGAADCVAALLEEHARARR